MRNFSLTHRTLFSALALLLATVSSAQTYFPPINTNQTWDTVSAGYDAQALQELNTFLDTTDTKAFIILENGKIAHEVYFDSFTQDSLWYLASAGKTMTAFLIGLAEADGHLAVLQNSKAYLESGWSSCGSAFEDSTTVLKHLTMTTGLNFSGNTDCTDPSCLTCSSASEPWYYHNAAYTLLYHMLDSVTPFGITNYILGKLSFTTGITGSYLPLGDNRVFISNARSMARFGLLVLARGDWAGNTIMDSGPGSYYDQMVNTTQSANESYGYLWWLNGKHSFRLPQSTAVFPGPLIPNAPSDLIAGLGKNDQKLYVVPSQNRVVVRLGNDGGQGLFAASGYDNQLWALINALDGSTSLEEWNSDESPYPNPGKGSLVIPSAREGQSYRLLNVYGKVLEHDFVQVEGRVQLNASPGLYLLQIDHGRTFKIILE